MNSLGKFLVLAAVLAMPMLAGCSSEDAPPPTASIESPPAAVNNTPPATTVPATPSRYPTTVTEAAERETDPLHPVVVIKTSLGSITVKLDREHAPITVTNFLTYADNGFYNGTLFHQAMADFMVLGGGYDTSFTEKHTSYPIRNEADNGLSNTAGTISMARHPNVIASSTSQFFFNVVDNTSLDHSGEEAENYGYCVFGKVISGMDVVEKISQLPVSEQHGMPSVPTTPVVIESVTRGS